MAAADDESKGTLEERVEYLEADIHGPKESRRREVSPGLFTEVHNLRKELKAVHEEIREIKRDRGEAEAVAQTRKTMVKLGAMMISAQIGIFGLLLRFLEVL